MPLVLNAGADPVAQDNLDETPMHKAVAADQVAMARMLLQKGVDISVTDHTGCVAVRGSTTAKKRGNGSTSFDGGARRRFDGIERTSHIRYERADLDDLFDPNMYEKESPINSVPQSTNTSYCITGSSLELFTFISATSCN